MIPESFIQELINRVDIYDVINKSVPLKKAGANYSACCPFHNEKSPSFTVSPSKQFYHCFGCGAHGTAIGFLMEYQGLSFVEAIHELAKLVGMIVPQETRTEDKPQQKVIPGMQDALQAAMNYYRAELKKSPRAIDYLKGRGLSGQIAANFQIGYAPAGWQNLQTVFEDYDNEVLETIGLVVKNEQGKRYDRFRDRIMFPIHDQKGQVIGFGGRVINPEDTPKYYNSPETPLFQKGHELYALFMARRAMREAGRALVVEGYMDVIALAQAGIDEAVAPLGTALTEHQIARLWRMSDQPILCFDGDAAGQKAAIRAISQDRQVMPLIGVNAEKIYLLTSAAGGAMAALAACLLVLQYDIHPAVGLTFGPILFVICVLGGLGNLIGGFLAAFLLAEIISIGGYFLQGEWGYVIAFVFFVIMIFARPGGILGRRA